MGCTVNNMNLDSVGLAIKTESIFLKIFKLLSALLLGVASVVCMSYFYIGHAKVIKMQDNCDSLIAPEQQVYCTNSTFYDFYFEVGPFPEDNPDVTELNRLLQGCDAECKTIGTRWSYVYTIGAVSMTAFSVQSLVLMLGVWISHLRVLAIFLQPILCLYNLGVVLTISVFRYNTIGKLAAYSMAPSKFESVDGQPRLSYERTYADDAKEIQALWIISLVYVIGQCVFGCFSAAPPTQDNLRKNGYLINEVGKLIDTTAVSD